MKMIIAVAITALSLCVAQGSSFAASPSAPMATASNSSRADKPSEPSFEESYAARDAADPGLATFQGGHQGVVIASSTLVIVLLVVLIIIIL